MMKILSLYRRYSTREIRALSFLSFLVSAILPSVSVAFLKSVLGIAYGNISILEASVIVLTYFALSFLGPFLSQTLEKKLSDFRLSKIAKEYFDAILTLELAQINDRLIAEKIKQGELFSAQSWKGYQRLMKLLPLVLSNFLALGLLGKQNNFFIAIIAMSIFALMAAVRDKRSLGHYQNIEAIVSKAKRHTAFYSNVLTDAGFLKEVKASSAENFIRQKLSERLGLAQNAINATLKDNTRYFVAQSVLSLCPYVAATAFLAHLVWEDKSYLSEVIVYISLIKTVQDLLKSQIKNVQKIKADLLLYEDYISFLNLTDENSSAGESVIDPDRPTAIEFDGVSFRYTEEGPDVLSQINCQFDAGTRTAIVGESGAGKSTLVKLLCGFLSPTEGSIKVNGIDMRRLNLKEYQKYIATVFQGTDLLSFELVDSLASTPEEVEKISDYICMMDLSALLSKLPQGIKSHYTQKIYDDGVELSGGELQTFVMLRALVKAASLYILDEPTSAMDVHNETKTIASFLDVTDGKTAVIVTHRLLITKFCDNIIVLKEGKIIEQGTHDQLMMQRQYYADLYNMQSEGFLNGK